MDGKTGDATALAAAAAGARGGSGGSFLLVHLLVIISDIL